MHVRSTRILITTLTYIIFLCALKMLNVAGLIKFTNIECIAYDKGFADFSICNLKVLKRNTIALNLHCNLYQVPVNNVSLSIKLLKRVNGYRPFLYNYTTDFCAFMKIPKRMPVIKIVLDLLKDNTNINHSCPYTNDIIIKNLVLSDNHIKLAPFPTGDYLLSLKVGAYNDWKALVKAYFAITEQ